MLNEYGRDGWELVSVASDDHEVGCQAEKRSDASSLRTAGGCRGQVNKLGAAITEAAGATSSLLWVLRRPLGED
jgi:hypothetical protein